jgi:hypothetical protein
MTKTASQPVREHCQKLTVAQAFDLHITNQLSPSTADTMIT